MTHWKKKFIQLSVEDAAILLLFLDDYSAHLARFQAGKSGQYLKARVDERIAKLRERIS